MASCQHYYGRFIDSTTCGFQEKPAIKDGRLSFDGGAAKRCFDAYANTFDCNNVEQDSLANVDCQGALIGNVANAGSCFFDSECAAASYCTGNGTTCPGTCQPRKAAGATRTNPSSFRECQAGLYSYDTTCQAYVLPGASCAPIAPTTYSQYCVSTHYCSATNVCLAKKVTGATCSNSTECANPNVCSNGTCAPRGAVGATCNSNPQLPCADDLFCDSVTSGGLGSCKAPAAAGGQCWSSYNCEIGLYCSGAVFPSSRGVCAVQKPVGGACSVTTYDECAKGLYCNAGFCAALKPAGAACMSNQCAAHLTCSTTCQPDACYDPTP